MKNEPYDIALHPTNPKRRMFPAVAAAAGMPSDPQKVIEEQRKLITEQSKTITNLLALLRAVVDDPEHQGTSIIEAEDFIKTYDSSKGAPQC